MAPSNAVPSVRLLNINIFTFMNTCGAVVYRVILLHNFIQISLNSGPVKVQILLTACWRFAMVRISDNGTGCKCHKNNSS